ncbi:hypothetical protein DLAC_09888 [Tieghemostelium lacteum]|uniref:Uncharacterized protein n=1 Tax=Tieghemostelium lacteum TaxID=361077 RepID=A0A151Z5I5_TIELA|nr:hypothetical protein DLAC_09888 [Tieghemostelium lacteum]|eukprot:KYQ89233.1 hypothetical protein DLAC_09888 [Tieghemostelium lacteum]
MSDKKPNNYKSSMNEVKDKVKKTILENNNNVDKKNSYKPYKSFSSYFQQKHRDNPKELPENIKFNMTEIYKGFNRMSGYALGIAASIGLVYFVGFTIFDKLKHSNDTKKIQN